MTDRHAPRLVAVAACAVLLSGCASRPLTEAERAFARTVTAEAVDLGEVRVVKGAVSAMIPTTIPVRERSTCRARLLPPQTEPAPGFFPAFVLGERMYFSRRIWRDDYLAGYPERLALRDAMRLAHELTHVWQWQARAETGYAPWRAAADHVALSDPYLVELDPARDFLDYGWEQQGVLVEEYVCCRALDPSAPRTAELRALVAQAFPGIAADEVVRSGDIALPWDGAEPQGICR
jgi:hypothetical protein